MARLRDGVATSARRVDLGVPEYSASRLGTASALRALNAAWGEEFYAVPQEAERDPAAAAATRRRRSVEPAMIASRT